jgi:hypothetical protein
MCVMQLEHLQISLAQTLLEPQGVSPRSYVPTSLHSQIKVQAIFTYTPVLYHINIFEFIVARRVSKASDVDSLINLTIYN